MLKHNLVMNLKLVNVNNNVHNDAQPSNDNDIEIEPAVDLDNVMIRKTLLLGNMVRKESLGFRNPCLFLPNHPRKRMMMILSALLK